MAVGEIVGILGANGAGKSSLGRAIAGLTPSRGLVQLMGFDISRANAAARVAAGVVYVPEARRVFTDLTVFENLRAGAWGRRGRSDWRAHLQEIYGRFPRLRERSGVKAGLLSGGEQQMLAIGRALMARPKVLILDEPSLGLAPATARQTAAMVASLVRDQSLSCLILEQNVTFAAALAERALLLHLGSTVSEVSGDVIRDPERVRTALIEAQAQVQEEARPTSQRDLPGSQVPESTRITGRLEGGDPR
jgi:branched-chain amino acid transport system ATP-binding protein